jgi:hypothetical protein
MKKLFLSYLIPYIIAGGICISCKKETSCEGCKENNKPPTAIAGLDQVITLPTDSISLDGRSSSDPDGTISVWLWTIISGPAFLQLVVRFKWNGGYLGIFCYETFNHFLWKHEFKNHLINKNDTKNPTHRFAAGDDQCNYFFL